MKYMFITQKHFTRIKCIATEMIASSLGNVYIYIFFTVHGLCEDNYMYTA
jgi:hypothetical protein